MSQLYHCLSGVCDGASLRSRLMPLADFLGLRRSEMPKPHIKYTIFLRVPCQVKQIFAIKAGDLLDSVKKQGLHPASPAKNSYSRRNIQFFYFTIKDFLLLTTSKITAASRTRPLTTFCRFWSIPMILIPKFRTPISNAPMITPGTVPVPP